MKPLEEVKREFVAQWMAKAVADLRSGRHLLAGGAEHAAAAAFLAQQAAEKCLKALLVWRQVEFSKTHDVQQLLDLVRTFNPELADRLQETSALTPYAVDYRYPGDLPEPTLDDARKAVELAERTCNEVSRQLPSDLRGEGRRS